MSLNFKFSENDDVLKEFNVHTTSLNDYTEYRKSLKSLQAIVNEYLTHLVNSESAAVEPHKEEDDYLSSDSENEKSPKRTLSTDRANQKNKLKKQ